MHVMILTTTNTLEKMIEVIFEAGFEDLHRLVSVNHRNRHPRQSRASYTGEVVITHARYGRGYRLGIWSRAPWRMWSTSTFDVRFLTS